MLKEPEIVGDKLRRALFIVWLATKFEKKISIADLRRLSGYSSSGIYSAKEAGWFTENKDGCIRVTDKGELYLEKNQLVVYKSIRQFMVSLLFFLFYLLIQKLSYQYFGILMMSRVSWLIMSMIIILIMIFFWYRIIWFLEKRATLRT